MRPIRIFVPAAPGGVTDIAARVIGQRLSELWGQQILIENRPGAGGSISVAVAAKSLPDGYTLLMTTSGEMTINPLIYPKLQYRPVQDFAPIVMTTITPLMWVANSSAPVNSVKDLIAAAKISPGRLSFYPPGRLMALFDRVKVVELGQMNTQLLAAGLQADMRCRIESHSGRSLNVGAIT